MTCETISGLLEVHGTKLHGWIQGVHAGGAPDTPMSAQIDMVSRRHGQQGSEGGRPCQIASLDQSKSTGKRWDRKELTSSVGGDLKAGERVVEDEFLWWLGKDFRGLGTRVG